MNEKRIIEAAQAVTQAKRDIERYDETYEDHCRDAATAYTARERAWDTLQEALVELAAAHQEDDGK